MQTLESVLAYRNEDVVARFAEDHSLSLQDADEIFTELKRWLWLCAKRKIELDAGIGEPFQIPLFNEANAIDQAWHTFLLFTEDYAFFCENYFGFFIHHNPRPSAERKEWQEEIAANPKKAKQIRRAQLEKVYGYLYDQLGPETLVRWCEEFPKRFSVKA